MFDIRKLFKSKPEPDENVNYQKKHENVMEFLKKKVDALVKAQELDTITADRFKIEFDIFHDIIQVLKKD